MGQKTHPIGLRLGIIKGWDSNWYGGKNFADKLVEDEKIRQYLLTRIPKGGIAKTVIERTLKKITITIHTSKPGIVIGKGGKEVDLLREEIKNLTSKDVQINIYEIKRPELDAVLVGQQVAQQLEARVSFRRAMKAALQGTMKQGAGGCKIMCSGRLGGAEMARTEQYKEGRVPLQTLRADIDYALVEAHTIYGVIGVKVWIFRQELYGKVDLSPNSGTAAGSGNFANANSDGGDRGGRNERGGGGKRNDRDRNKKGNNNNNNRQRNNNQGNKKK
ncbi:MAG: 30S ribosomal protein S3 [Bacteroidia bacterium]